MTTKHHVIVAEQVVQTYLARGYHRSAMTVQEKVGAAAWEFLDDNRAQLVVLEIDQDQHEQLNQNPRRYRVKVARDFFTTDLKVKQCEVLGEDNDVVDATFVADTGDDGGPFMVAPSELYLSAQEAGLGSAEYVRNQIALHRAAITNLENFLRQYT